MSHNSFQLQGFILFLLFFRKNLKKKPAVVLDFFFARYRGPRATNLATFGLKSVMKQD